MCSEHWTEQRAAAINTLIATANLNDIDSQTRIADVVARLHELLFWNWRRQSAAEAG